MKKFVSIIFLLAGCCSALFAQDWKEPFQVLDCVNTIDKNGLPVKRFEFVDLRQTIRIGENGYCVLIHRTGEAYEFLSDTIVAIRNLRLSNEEGTGELSTLSLKQLFDPFITTGKGNRKVLPLVFPPEEGNMRLGNNDDLCLQWIPGRLKQPYTIRITDNFGGELLPSFVTNEPELLVSRRELRKIGADVNLLVISVFQGGDSEIASGKVQTNWEKPGKSFFQCDGSAFQALMVAHYLEEARMEKQAEEFYKLATTRSEIPVYAELQKRFESRKVASKSNTATGGAFQVLDCLNTWTENNTAVNRFDRVALDQTLRIDHNGYCILVHESGEAIELSGDKVFVVTALPLANEGGTGEFTTAPKLESLFNPKNSNASRGWGHEPFWTFPGQYPVVLGPEDDLCLTWTKGRTNNYVITVADLYGEQLLEPFKTEKNELVISQESLQEIPSYITEIVIGVRDNAFHITECKVTINRLTKGRSFFRCSASAFQAAMQAHLLEQNMMYEAAEHFYQVAVSRSSLPVYKELQKLFEARVKRIK